VAGDASAKAESAALCHARVKVFALARLRGSDPAFGIAGDRRRRSARHGTGGGAGDADSCQAPPPPH